MFNPERLSLIVQPIGDGGLRFFGYQTDDAEATVTAAGYATDAAGYGLRAYDLIFVSPLAGTVEPYILAVDAIDADGHATLASPGPIGDLKSANNLSDLTNAATARTNLGLGSAAVLDSGSASGNLKALNTDGGFTFETSAPTVNFMPAGLLGGSYDASHLVSSTDTVTAYTGMRATEVVRRIVTGTGSNNPNSDHALIALAAKDDLDSASLGEIGAIRGWAFQNAWGDSSAMLLGSYKKVGDGTANEGGMTSIEVTARRFTTDLSTYDHWMNCITGFSPNPTSTWGSRALIGFYSEMHSGAGFANFLGITDGAETGTGTMSYLISGFRQRDIDTRYFSVDYRGFINAIWNDAGATGIEWTRKRDSASPAASDVIARDVFTGKNASAADIEYVSAYAAIVDTTAGSEDGQWTLRTFVNGAAADQVTVKNGVAIGSPTSSTQGTGTLNLAGALLINANTVIDANRHLRLRSYTVATLPSATPAGMMIYVSDGTTNKRLAVSDATNWRFPDGNIVS